jgi:WD40 repeat-containing protein SMU1
LAKNLSLNIESDTVPPNRLVQLLALGLEYEQILKNGGRRTQPQPMKTQ